MSHMFFRNRIQNNILNRFGADAGKTLTEVDLMDWAEEKLLCRDRREVKAALKHLVREGLLLATEAGYRIDPSNQIS